MPNDPCTHLGRLHDVVPRTPPRGEACPKSGDRRAHLRLRLTCGHVGCCDRSPGKHATTRCHAASHPLIRSFERGEDGGWCYVDELFLEPAPRATGRSA